MNRDEMTALLGLMAARDGRTVGRVEVEAWLEDAGQWDFQTARAAVARHYQRSREFMRPLDLTQGIKAIRLERIEAAGPIVPPAHLADDPRAEIDWLRARREAIADGTHTPEPEPRAIDSVPSAAQVEAIVTSIADAKRVRRADLAPPPPPASPTVSREQTDAMEAERSRQLAAIAQRIDPQE